MVLRNRRAERENQKIEKKTKKVLQFEKKSL